MFDWSAAPTNQLSGIASRRRYAARLAGVSVGSMENKRTRNCVGSAVEAPSVFLNCATVSKHAEGQRVYMGNTTTG